MIYVFTKELIIYGIAILLNPNYPHSSFTCHSKDNHSCFVRSFKAYGNNYIEIKLLKAGQKEKGYAEGLIELREDVIKTKK